MGVFHWQLREVQKPGCNDRKYVSGHCHGFSIKHCSITDVNTVRGGALWTWLHHEVSDFGLVHLWSHHLKAFFERQWKHQEVGPGQKCAPGGTSLKQVHSPSPSFLISLLCFRRQTPLLLYPATVKELICLPREKLPT